MKTSNLSAVSFMCIIGIAVANNASAAGSVRMLGGPGTHNGTSSAVAMRGGTSRAGSLRISPSKTRVISTGTRTKSDGTTAPTERLSIGKLLGGATSVSTTSAAPAAAETAGSIAELNNQINDIHNTIQTIDGNITNLENTKQDNLAAGNYIKIENDEVSLDLTELEEYLADNLDLSNPIDIRYNGTDDVLEWTKDGTTWTTLLDIADLLGDYVTANDLQNAINNIVIPEQQQADWNETDNTKPSFIANKPDLSVYATTTALQNAIDSIPDDQVQANWSETDNTKPSFIANKPTNLATTSNLANYQIKPTSGIAEGKVLTYTGTNADTNVSASYIQIPVATGAPSTVAPIGFVEMWLQ